MILVSVHVGSLVDPEVGAAAIVNASNPHVALGSGVSGAIAEACGELAFQREVRAAWEHDFDQPLEPDDCLVTGSGTSDAFEWVLHVPAVDYTKRDPETGRSSGPRRVRDCTLAALEEAALRIPGRRLAMPLLGAGHGGLGEVRSADAMMGAIRTFAERHSSATLAVCFTVLRPELARVVEHAAAKHGVPFA